MSQATMTSKGQVTVPREVREDLGLQPGSKVMFVKLGERNYRVVARTGQIEDLFGILGSPSVPVMSVEEENDAIGRAAAEGAMRGLEH